MSTPVTWDDIQPGRLIRYQHVSRLRRLEGKPLVVRSARVEQVSRPSEKVAGHISITPLTKAGEPDARIGRHSLFGLDFVVSVELAADVSEEATGV